MAKDKGIKNFFFQKNSYLESPSKYLSYNIVKLDKDRSTKLAVFLFDEFKNNYVLEFIRDEPLKLNEEERKIFWQLLEYGFKELN